MSVNGIWKVEIPGIHGWESTATAFIEDGKYRGGSENHYLVGTYEVCGNRIKISASGEQRGQGRTMFGKNQESLELNFEGEINGDVMQGEARDAEGDHRISVQISRLADLP